MARVLSSQLTIGLFPLDVLHDVPGIDTRCDQFRALFAQFGKRPLTVLIDKGHARKVHNALAFPASGFCLCPAGLQFRNPRLNQPAFECPLLFGQRLGDRYS